ncbi:ImmA/IrrE family metallo-endopeptidase [Amycolatopsis sp. lyj-346]|uniref:ImmA/IrrE family metallo-endopeptidase n=1 Tax=Amycolatopsis sp. lyj-346 TaxID=2789289 RepID=UPI00397CB96D
MQLNEQSLIDTVRSVMPTSMLGLLKRGITESEARRIAEQQALKLLELLDIKEPSVDIEMIAELPDIEVNVLPKLPISGISIWENNKWHIGINANESLWRARATLAHELKHILDDPFHETIYPDWPRNSFELYAPAERICDYFAGCVLVPAPWLKEAWSKGIHDIARLASLFAVSESLIEVRIKQTRVAQTQGTITRLRGYPVSAYKRSAGLVMAAQRKIVGESKTQKRDEETISEKVERNEKHELQPCVATG